MNSQPTKPLSSPDQIVSTAAALTALKSGPNGIMVTAHPGNGSVVIRVSGLDVTTTKGQPLAAGGSFTFPVADASDLMAVAESGGSGTLCATAV